MMHYSDEEIFYIWLDGFSRFTATDKNTLLQKVEFLSDFSFGAEYFFGADVTPEQRENYADLQAFLADEAAMRNLPQIFTADNVFCIPKIHHAYPPILRQEPDAPLVLYCLGNADLLQSDKFAVIGSRRIPPAMEKLTESVAYDLTERYAVVTGMADGGDTAALQGAAQGNKVICILPCGIDTALDKEQVQTAAAHGLVISPFPYGQSAMKYCYVKRNTVIAALSEGILLVAADEGSGTLSTVREAILRKKRLFAFPYAPGVAAGKACNQLIKNGAALCECAEDVFSAMDAPEKGDADFSSLADPKSDFGTENRKENRTNTEILQKNNAKDLSEEQKTVLEVLTTYGESHIIEITQRTGLNEQQTLIALSMLEIKQLAVRCGGNRFAPNVSNKR